MLKLSSMENANHSFSRFSQKMAVKTVYVCVDRDTENALEEIPSMPEQFRYGVNRVVEALQPVVARGLKAVLLFGVPSNLTKVSIHNTSIRVQKNLFFK